MLHSRRFNLLMAFICHEMLVVAYYFQFVEKLEPCPLCIFQRITVLFIGLWFLARAIHNPRLGSKLNLLYSIPGLLTAVIGIAISGRHVWLQNLPKDEVPACGPALDYLMDILPFNEVLTTVLKGSGECAEVSWRMFGLTMPMYTMAFFIGCAAIFIWQTYRHFKPASTAF